MTRQTLALIHVRCHCLTDGKTAMVSVTPAWQQDGLAVTPSLSGALKPLSRLWTVTHVRSGYAVMADINGKQAAIRAATTFLAAGNWDRSRTTLSRDKVLRSTAIKIRDQLRKEGTLE